MTLRVSLFALILSCVAGPAGAQETGSWPLFRGDASHTGRSAAAGPQAPLLQWQHGLERLTYSSPTVGPDGTVYIGSFHGLYAVAPGGAVRWTAPVNDFTISSPAVGGDGLVFMGSTDGVLYALRRDDGAVRWQYPTGAEIWSSPTIGPDGTVYIGAADGGFHAIDPATGLARWRFDAPAEVAATATIGPDGTLYVASIDGQIDVLAAADGRPRQTFSVPARIVSSPALDADGTLYVADLDGVLHAFDPATGRTRWTARLGGVLISSPAIGRDGAIYVGSTDGHLYAVDAGTGAPRWSAALDGAVYASPALDTNGTVYVGSAPGVDGAGRLVAVEPAGGAVLWSFRASTPIWSSPAIDAGGNLYFASAGTVSSPGRLYKLEAVSFTVEFPNEPVAGVEQTVHVRIPAPPQATSGTLFYRRGGERRFAETPLTVAADGRTFDGRVPADFVTPRGIEYYVALTDGQQTSTYPATDPQANPAVQRVYVDALAFPVPLPARGFRMVSVPLDIGAPAAADVLQDDYGTYDPVKWRLFHWQNGGYAEYPDLPATFRPGHAFFLVTRAGRPFDVEDGFSVDTSEPFVLTLAPGWNQVGLPFAFPIDWDAVHVQNAADAGALREIAFFDGQEMIQDPSVLHPLQPWTGYFVRNALDRPVPIVFPNVEAVAAVAKQAQSSFEPPGGYVLNLSARSLGSSLHDTQNWIGFTAAGTPPERLDLREAPPFGPSLRLSIVADGARYAARYASPTGSGHRWALELEAAGAPAERTWVEVTLAARGTLPDGYALYVIDDDRRQLVPVVENRVRIDVGDRLPVRHLSLVLGPAAFAADELGDVSPPAPTFFLDQNFPNPFNPQTTIHYGMDRPAHVTLDVYDAAGRHVATLVDGRQETGVYDVVWNGRDAGGRQVASGIYFYRLRAGTFVSARPMLLLR